MSNEVWTIHAYDNLLIYRVDYNERIETIKTQKPDNEQSIRLQCFAVLPAEAVEKLPKYLVKANRAYEKADKAWWKAYRKRQKAYREWKKAARAWDKASQEWWKAYRRWICTKGKNFHTKYCDCQHWNREKLIFPEPQENKQNKI